MMDAARSVLVNFDLWEYGHGTDNPHPRDLFGIPRATQRAWIPQSIADAIWTLFEFSTTEERDAFIANPPDRFPKPSTEPQWFYDHWTDYETHNRDVCEYCQMEKRYSA